MTIILSIIAIGAFLVILGASPGVIKKRRYDLAMKSIERQFWALRDHFEQLAKAVSEAAITWSDFSSSFTDKHKVDIK